MTAVADYPPCPICGEPSVAQITDHSCEQCADSYKFCIRHGEEAEAIAGHGPAGPTQGEES